MSLNFQLAAGGYVYRPLRRSTPAQFGWDVYALQTGLLAIGHDLPKWGPDGYLGDETSTVIWRFQQANRLTEDGIAGIATQKKIARILAERARMKFRLPFGIPYGHIEKESSFQLGNHTPPYTDPQRSRDCGVVQRNTNFATVQAGFTTGESVEVCAKRVRVYHDKYVIWGVDERRAWELGAGSWNAPAWTDRLAAGEALADGFRERIEAYIDDVTVYMKE